MEELIPRLYKNYCDYRNLRQMLPNILDGCLPVKKRLLLSTHISARGHFVKSNVVIGHVVGHFHPHSEPYDALAILVQDGVIDGQGQWGFSLGMIKQKQAAMRYTEVKTNNFIEEMMFKYVNDVVWEAEECDPEPVALPTMIPLCLFAKARANPVGFGFKATIPTYKIEDLIKRLKYLLSDKKRRVVIKPYIEGCEILSSNDDCESLLTSGEGKIFIRGLYDKCPEHFKLIIRGWSFENTFESIYNSIDKSGLLSNGDVIMRDSSSDEEGTKIVFEVARSRNRPDMYARLEEAVEKALTASVSYKMYAADLVNNTIVAPSIDDMLLTTYNYFKDTVKVHLERRIKESYEVAKELKIISEMKKHLNIISENKDADKAIDLMAQKISVDREIIKDIVERYKIRKLMTLDTDITKLKEDVKQYKANLANIDDYISQKYDNILKVK